MAYQINYSALDRLFHQVAFAAPFIQITAADMERAAYGGAYRAARAARPIFVTSLPRAGTTVLLESMAEFPSIATHIYRDMPFVLAPILWAKLSGPFRTPSAPKERAHGDGVIVGFDSPEAFEEILWRTCWPRKYHAHAIDLWHAADRQADATAFFLEHMKKIVALRRPDRLTDARYLSKNNANIARLELLPRMFADASIVIPVRRPLDHAASLLRQHRNFLAIHAESPFVRRYMGDIGHYEFGALHRPLAFPGVDEHLAGRDPLAIDYWLAYWIAAFEYVAAHRGNAVVVGYEGLCENAPTGLRALCARLDLPDEGRLGAAAARFRPSPPPRPDSSADAALVARAEALHRQLLGSV